VSSDLPQTPWGVSRSIEFTDRGERVILRKRGLAPVGKYSNPIKGDTP